MERDVLTTLGNMKELGMEKTRQAVVEKVDRVDQVVGKMGEVMILRCKYVVGFLSKLKVNILDYRARSNLSWKVERSSGEILNLDSQSRKLKISLEPETAGIYHCYSGGKLAHSFHMTLKLDKL